MKKYIEINGKKCLKAETTDKYSIIYFLDDEGNTLGYKKHNLKEFTKIVRVYDYYALLNKHDFLIWTDIGKDIDEELENNAQKWFDGLREDGIDPYEINYPPTVKSEILQEDGKFKVDEGCLDLDDENKGYMTSENSCAVYSDETMSKVLETQKNYSVFAFDDFSFRFEEELDTDYVEGVTKRIIELYSTRLVEINGISKTFYAHYLHSYDFTLEKQFIEEQIAKIKK